MYEGWDDVAFGGGCGELWECERARSGGLLDLPCGANNADCGIGRVDVSTWSTFGQVDTVGSTIHNGSVNKRK